MMLECVQKSQILLQGHGDRVWSLSFSPDGRYLASGSEDRSVMIWDIARQRERFTIFGNADGVNAVLYSPDGALLASGGEEGCLRVWNFRTGQTWKHHCLSGGINALAFAPAGRLLATGGGLYGRSGVVKLWDPVRGQELARLNGHHNEVLTLAFSPSGRYLVSGDFDGVLKLWDVATGRHLRTIEGHLGAVWKVEFHWNDRTLISSGEDGKIRFWERATGQGVYDLPGIPFGVLSFALDSQGQRLCFVGFDGSVKLVNLSEPWRHTQLGRHRDAVFSVCFAPDGRTVASAGMDRQVALWNAELGDDEAAQDRPEEPPVYRTRYPMKISLN